MASEGVPPQVSEGASATSDEFNLEDFDEPDAPETETSRRYPSSIGSKCQPNLYSTPLRIQCNTFSLHTTTYVLR
eukprot:scaffold23247_cov42-Cyclotella_meneghiniana.AAC.1